MATPTMRVFSLFKAVIRPMIESAADDRTSISDRADQDLGEKNRRELEKLKKRMGKDLMMFTLDW